MSLQVNDSHSEKSEEIVVNQKYQEWMNTSVKGLASQGFNRSSDSGFCLYRLGKNPEATQKCAFGWLIPNSLYNPVLERLSITSIIIGYVSGEVGRLGSMIEKHLKIERESDLNFLNSLQECHDNAYTGLRDNPKKMRTALVALCIQYHLDIPPGLLIE